MKDSAPLEIIDPSHGVATADCQTICECDQPTPLHRCHERLRGGRVRAKERRAERWRWPTCSTRRGKSRPPSSCPDRERRSSCRGGGHASKARFAFAAVDVVVVAVADGGEVVVDRSWRGYE